MNLKQFYEQSKEIQTYEEFKNMNRVYSIPECTQKQELEAKIQNTVQKLTNTLPKDKKYFTLQITKQLKKEQDPLLLEYKNLITMKLVQQGYNISNLQYHTTNDGKIYKARY